MNQRESHILQELVEWHIEHGLPVASQTLAGQVSLRMSPATIRNILQALDRAGYIEQPHTSAGRVPTDKGYRYYVNHLLASPRRLQAREQAQIQASLHAGDQASALSVSLARLLARLSHTVVVSVTFPSDIRFVGLSDLLSNLAADEFDIARELSRLVDMVNEEAPRVAASLPDDVAVYIGAENPWFNAQYTSVVVRKTVPDQPDSAVLILAGPKRMAYHRNVALVDYVAELFEEQL
ncbi:MAG TPA: hypothetical protein VJC05_04010 [Candidatus Andersenbacteria bacterium]|nr:hypothetical protein [Candidatus Andersenbacteria bacterium]